MPGDDRHPLIPRREVDPRRELPELELEVLARWRERDVFAESLRRPRGRAALESSTRGRRPRTGRRARTTCSRACSRTSTRASRRCAAISSSARAAGTATACRSRSPSSRSSASHRRPKIEEYGIGEFNARCRESVFTYLEEWNRLTERIGFWIDLDDAYRTLDESYIESVWWALSQIDGAGLLYEGHKVVPVLPALRHGALLARGRAGLRGRRRRERLRQARRGWRSRSCERRPPARLDDDAVDAARQRRCRGRRPNATYARVRLDGEHFVIVADRVGAVLGEGADDRSSASRRGAGRALRRLRGPDLRARRPRAGRAAGPRRRLRDDRGRHRHRAPRAGVRRGRLPRRRGGRDLRPATTRGRCTTRSSATAPTTAPAQPRRRPYAGRSVKDRAAAARADRGTATRAACCCATRTTSTPTRTAGAAARRCSTTPNRRGTSPRRSCATAARRQRDRRLAPAAHQARALRRLARATTSTGRSRASATGARRCRSGAASDGHVHVASAPSPSSRSARAGSSPTRTARSSTSSSSPARTRTPTASRLRQADAPRAGGDRRLVRLGLDAVRAAPLPVRARRALRARLPGRLHLRGARPDARLVLLAARRRDAARRATRRTATSSASG